MHASIKRPLSPLTSHGALLIILGRTAALEIMLSLSFLMGAKGQSFRNDNGGIRERWGKGEVARKSSDKTRGNPPLELHIYTDWSIISLLWCTWLSIHGNLLSIQFKQSLWTCVVIWAAREEWRRGVEESEYYRESACAEISVIFVLLMLKLNKRSSFWTVSLVTLENFKLIHLKT